MDDVKTTKAVENLDERVDNVSLIISGKRKIALEDAFVYVGNGNLIVRLDKMDERISDSNNKMSNIEKS